MTRVSVSINNPQESASSGVPQIRIQRRTDPLELRNTSNDAPVPPTVPTADPSQSDTPEDLPRLLRDAQIFETQLSAHEQKMQQERIMKPDDAITTSYILSLLEIYEDLLLVKISDAEDVGSDAVAVWESAARSKVPELVDKQWSFLRIKFDKLKLVLSKMQASSQPGQAKVMSEMKKHLRLCSSVFQNQILTLKFRWDVDFNGMGVDLFRRGVESDRYPVYSSGAGLAYFCIHRSLLYAGDTARYAAGYEPVAGPNVWITSELLYFQAARMKPEDGAPLSKLALVATQQKRNFNAAYWNCLSLSCKIPSSIAKDNLRMLYSKVLDRRKSTRGETGSWDDGTEVSAIQTMLKNISDLFLEFHRNAFFFDNAPAAGLLTQYGQVVEVFSNLADKAWQMDHSVPEWWDVAEDCAWFLKKAIVILIITYHELNSQFTQVSQRGDRTTEQSATLEKIRHVQVMIAVMFFDLIARGLRAIQTEMTLKGPTIKPTHAPAKGKGSHLGSPKLASAPGLLPINQQEHRASRDQLSQGSEGGSESDTSGLPSGLSLSQVSNASNVSGEHPGERSEAPSGILWTHQDPEGSVDLPELLGGIETEPDFLEMLFDDTEGANEPKNGPEIIVTGSDGPQADVRRRRNPIVCAFAPVGLGCMWLATNLNVITQYRRYIGTFANGDSKTYLMKRLYRFARAVAGFTNLFSMFADMDGSEDCLPEDEELLGTSPLREHYRTTMNPESLRAVLSQPIPDCVLSDPSNPNAPKSKFRADGNTGQPSSMWEKVGRSYIPESERVAARVSRVAFLAKRMSEQSDCEFFRFEEGDGTFAVYDDQARKKGQQKIMQALARERLRDQVDNLERQVRKIQDLSVPMAIFDADCFVSHLRKIKNWLMAKSCSIVVAQDVISSLDRTKKGTDPYNARSREATRYLEQRFKYRTEYLQAQKENEEIVLWDRTGTVDAPNAGSEDEPLVIPKAYRSMLACCLHYNANVEHRPVDDSDIPFALVTNDTELAGFAAKLGLPTCTMREWTKRVEQKARTRRIEMRRGVS
ncbi:hypothetical protein BJ742DRAFT_791903 [Cladochytrium replicatum]|nr:hypothetical protein BJ742DRAFT_791903 [Cladochytrium replicatum]